MPTVRTRPSLPPPTIAARRSREGDYADLMDALSEAFSGTAQPVPGECVDGRCTFIWYLETGYQTTVSPEKLHVYTGEENVETISPEVQGAQFERAVELAYCQPFVQGYFNFLMWDEARLEGWQSGPFWADRTPKESYETVQAGDRGRRRPAASTARSSKEPPRTRPESLRRP